MRYSPHEYQKYAINFIKEHPIAAILLDMGMGKTSIVLAAIDEQPVRLDVAFVESRIVTLEDMILILLVESFTLTQIIYDIIEKS